MKTVHEIIDLRETNTEAHGSILFKTEIDLCVNLNKNS